MDLRDKVEEVIEKIRPALKAHGGDIEFVGIKDETVEVKLIGACAGCPVSQMTLRGVVEATIKKEIPEIARVEAV